MTNMRQNPINTELIWWFSHTFLTFWTNTYRPPAVLYKVWVGKWLRLTTELGWAQLSISDLVVMEVGLIALTLSLSFSSSSFCCRFSISALKFSMSCWLNKQVHYNCCMLNGRVSNKTGNISQMCYFFFILHTWNESFGLQLH